MQPVTAQFMLVIARCPNRRRRCESEMLSPQTLTTLPQSTTRYLPARLQSTAILQPPARTGLRGGMRASPKATRCWWLKTPIESPVRLLRRLPRLARLQIHGRRHCARSSRDAGPRRWNGVAQGARCARQRAQKTHDDCRSGLGKCGIAAFSRALRLSAGRPAARSRIQI